MLPPREGDDCGNQRDVNDSHSSLDTCYEEVNIVQLSEVSALWMAVSSG
jgi:hypothetical protein